MDYARWGSHLAHGSYCINYKSQILKNNDIVKLLNLCNCCIRHKTNRPSKYKRSTKIEYNGFRFNKNHTCECNCRIYLDLFRYIPIEERYL